MDHSGHFTLDELWDAMRDSVGFDDSVDPAGGAAAIADTEFTTLGYDSLAVLELAGLVQRRYGVPVPDEALTGLSTPRNLVDFVNARLTEAEI